MKRIEMTIAKEELENLKAQIQNLERQNELRVKLFDDLEKVVSKEITSNECLRNQIYGMETKIKNLRKEKEVNQDRIDYLTDRIKLLDEEADKANTLLRIIQVTANMVIFNPKNA